MKKLFVRKTSAIIVSLMIVSMLLPIVAFANHSGFENLRYDNSQEKVLGKVYVDSTVYGTSGFLIQGGDNNDKVQVNVYSKTGAKVATTYATYVTYSGASAEHYFYEISLNNAATSLYGQYPLTVSFWDPLHATYVTSGNIEFSSGGGSGGGGGYTGPIGGGNNGGTVIDIAAGSDGRVGSAALTAALAADGSAAISITGDVAILPASALTSTGSVTIVTDEGVTYTLPLSGIDVNALATALGVTVANLDIRVEISALTGSSAAAVDKAAAAVGGDVVAPVIDFKVVASGGGKTQEITNFPVYVSRSIPLTEAVSDLNTVTGVVYDETAGTVSFVPSTFATVDGKTVATVKRKGNSIYTVVKVTAKSFPDLTGHWAKADVEKLAGKYVVTGTSATTFEPKRSITRAETAALIVRSLGLETVTNSTYKFSDVSAGKWYTNVVASAAKAGIINGYQDGSFKPDAAITRRDLAAMIVRAQAFAGKKVALTDAQVSQALTGYSDVATLGGQKTNVAIAVSTGLMKGQSGKKLAGLSNTNRAEAATLIARLLKDVGFIN